MKYIRTKDGIYLYGIGGQSKPPYYCVPNYDGTKLLTKYGLSNDYPVEEHTIIKQSDDLKELCDFIVFEWQDERTPQFMPCDHISLKVAKEINPKYCIVYGAIYIKGKGLIYVAKMNEKGELELL